MDGMAKSGMTVWLLVGHDDTSRSLGRILVFPLFSAATKFVLDEQKKDSMEWRETDKLKDGTVVYTSSFGNYLQIHEKVII